jgi:polysaccharide biosynthesis protein PslE
MPRLPYFEQGLSRTDISRLVRKYRLLVALVFVFGTLGMWVALPILFTDLYESQVRLLVKIGRENTETPTTVQNGQVFSQGVRLADTNTEVQILQSASLVQAVVDKLGPDAFKSELVAPTSFWGYPKYYAKLTARRAKEVYKEFLIAASLKKRLTPREDAILAVANGIKVEPVRDSDILTLKVRTPSPKLSVDVVAILLDQYFQARGETRRISAGSDFFLTRFNEAKARLVQTQALRAALREKHELTSPEQQRSQYLDQLAGIRAEQMRNEAQLAQLTQQKAIAQTHMRELPGEVSKERVEGRNPGLEPILERLTELRMERAKVASRYLETSAPVEKVDLEIKELEAALATVAPSILSSVTTQANPEKRGFEAALGQYDVELAGITARNRQITAPVPEISARLKEITQGIDALETADREYRRAEEEYLSLSKRLADSRMSEALDAERVANVVAVEKPNTPIEPIAPNKVFLMEIAMAVSLVLGIALAALLEAIDDRIEDEHGLVNSELAYLGTIQLEGSDA